MRNDCGRISKSAQGSDAMNSKPKFYKTQSMQFRILTTIIFAMLAITVFIGSISIYEVDQYIQNETKNLVAVTCDHEGAQINSIFEGMEKSVKVMESYIMDFFTSQTDIEDRAFQEEVVNNTERMFTEVAKHASGAVAYYFRIDPAITNDNVGFFYSKTPSSDWFISFAPTDILRYEKDDTEHVGWFWQPYEAGKPVWMLPYYNQNNHIYMISYVVPMYHNGRFFGVVGMDFDYTVLEERVLGIEIYENGFARLEVDGTAIHSENCVAAGEDLQDQRQYLRAEEALANGMTLAVFADYDDIRQIRDDISFDLLLSVVFLSAIFTAVAIVVVRKFVVPLKTISDASVKLSNGDYNVELGHSKITEIELLNTAFRNMADHLREREKELRISANRDALTGFRNTTAYKSWVADFESESKDPNAVYGVAVFDVNQLKQVNDTYGHQAGDKLIVAAANAIADVFKRSPVFRIGGDEFLAVLRNRDLQDCRELFAKLDAVCENTALEEDKAPVSIARGFAVFDPGKDSGFEDVFQRADNAMYENKRKTKQENGILPEA